jgi:hypothetical protein
LRRDNKANIAIIITKVLDWFSKQTKFERAIKMENTGQKAPFLAVLITVIISIVGCEQQEFSNTKKFRFIADENRRLKEQLEQCHRQIEKCHQEKFDLNEKAQEEVKVVEDIALGYYEEIRILREQNQKLSAEIEQINR